MLSTSTSTRSPIATLVQDTTVLTNSAAQDVAVNKYAGIVACTSLSASIHALVDSEDTIVETATAISKHSGFVASASFEASLNAMLTADGVTLAPGAAVVAEVKIEPTTANVKEAMTISGSVYTLDSEPAVFDQSPASLMASTSAGSTIGSIWSVSERPYPTIGAAKLRNHATRAQKNEAWWKVPTQRAIRPPSWCSYDSDFTSETVSKILPSRFTASALSAVKACSYPPASCSPVEPYGSGCRTHAQQLAHLYKAAREADVPIKSLLEMISDKPEELFVPAPAPVKKGSQARQALLQLGSAVSRILN